MKSVRTEMAPVPIGPYSQAIISDKMIFCSGQLGIDPITKKLVTSGTADEARQGIENIRAILEAAGSSLEKVVKVTIFMTDLDHFKEVNAIYADSFKEPFPARTTVGVARLPLGATIEIDVVASI
ncbi:MAG TPA: RidA family protein [Methanomassiliicoccales archaeon]|jgi:2-iminobutanoate/2-iminopropanoate deaminase